MGTVISNLKAKFGVDTSDFKNGLKDGEKAVSDFKGMAGDTLDEFASLFGTNMGAVNEAIGTAHKSINFMAQAFKGAAAGGDVLAISMKVLKVALVSTGIGAVVVALGSLIAYFTKSGEGAERFSKILAQIKSVFDVVIDRFVKFGKGLWDMMSGKFKQGWTEMKDAFKGIGEEIKTDWQEAGKLAIAAETLEDREIALITSLEERKAKISELRLQAKEETEDQRKKLALLKQAEALVKSVYADEISLERERLRVMKERLAIKSSDPTDEERKAIAEQEAKLNSLLREQNGELRGIVKERNAVVEAIKKEATELKKIPVNGIDDKGTKLELKDPTKQYLYDIAKATAGAKTAMQEFGYVAIDVRKAVKLALADLCVSFAELFASMLKGKASFADLKNMAFSAMGDLCISLGKTAILAGIGVDAISRSLQSMKGGSAIIAGIALISFGMAIKSSLSSLGGASSSSSPSPGGGTFDTRSKANNQAITINVTGKITGSGKDLLCIIENESKRKVVTT